MKRTGMPVEYEELAWPRGDIPGKLKYRFPVPGEVKVLISSVTGTMAGGDSGGGPWDVKALCPIEGVVGRYRVTGREKVWFVRVTRRLGSPELEKSLLDYLAGEGIPVNEIAGWQIIRQGGRDYRADVRPFIEGRHFDGSEKDMERIASLLGRLHGKLRSFEGAGPVRSAAASRYGNLEKIREQLGDAVRRDDFRLFRERAPWAERHKGWLAAMVREYAPHFHRLPGAQCLHGEIHQANILFPDKSGDAVLIDFEESVHNFAPVAWDLAYMIQRFCLSDDPAEGVFKKRMGVVRESYGEKVAEISRMMRQSAWYNIALILDERIHHNIVNPLSEYDKFVALERQGEKLETRGW